MSFWPRERNIELPNLQIDVIPLCDELILFHWTFISLHFVFVACDTPQGT
jgi:hypothetical protein